MDTGFWNGLVGGNSDASPMLRWPRVWQGLAWAMVAIVVWLSLTPTPPTPPKMLAWDKANHLLAYGSLMFLFAQAFARHWRWPAFLLVLGFVLELLQGWSGFRSFDLFDMLANALGVLLGLFLAQTFLGRSVAVIDRWLFRHIG